jgi:serine/threonine protein kinase
VLTLAYILIALYYLESKNLVHRDISFTNILLRSPNRGGDSQSKIEKRREIMDELGLSQIEEFRVKLNCREGLLIDFDYASLLDPKKTTGQAGVCDVDESMDESYVESEGRIRSSGQSSSQVSGEGSSQGEGFELVGDEDNSKTVIQPFGKNFSGVRTVSHF